MSIANPTQLVDEFKKSGEFDRLRRELLKQFQRGDGISMFTSRIEDIARQRLVTDQKLLQYIPHDVVHRELMQEVDRYPVVERAVSDVRMLSDPSFAASIRSTAQRILDEDKAKKELPPSSTSSLQPPPRDDDAKIGSPRGTDINQQEAPSQPPESAIDHPDEDLQNSIPFCGSGKESGT